ncbi:MAG: hypothetical protein JXA64_00140 [Candidatus Fermentibacteraceae bacterium]|nr:hypothetical protein [Candidatus Fermentibacteraceae bacterium]MBN2607493.1 hypothetical protein [Candidatus Fermentibacteraceae bacterium]
MNDTGRAEELCERIGRQALEGGYSLNPDREFIMELMEGLLTNTDRYGYMACPCRLADGRRDEDLDIICPCDYRDADLVEYGACYCGLYVADEVSEGGIELKAVPERRPADPAERAGRRRGGGDTGSMSLPYPVYRCRVCGYLCAREEPPGKCPVCGVSSDRFQRFM